MTEHTTSRPAVRPSPDPLPHDATAATPRGRHVDRRRWRRWGLAGLGIAAVAVASACEARVQDDVLTVVGSDGGEAIALRLADGDPAHLEVDWNADGSAELVFPRSDFSRIEVDGAGGDDVLIIDESHGSFTDTETTRLIGGAGDDALIGGSGAEWLDGGEGDDVLEGNQGVDLVVGRAGADEVRWDAGDAGEIVNGGTGADRLVFVGSDVAETFAVSAVGTRARLTRDVDAVQMDLAGVEAVEIHPSGGTDTVRPGDVSGTGLTTIAIDVAAASGGDDAATDTVVVPPVASIGRDATAATIDGLGAPVRVINGSADDRIHVVGTTTSETQAFHGTGSADAVDVVADGTDVAVFGATPGLPVLLSAVDLVDVDLGGGDDSFTATGNLAALTMLDVDGGSGADTLRGGNGADVLVGGDGADMIDANQGGDIVSAGLGDDLLQWDPGDANDIVDGGTGGTDRFVLNGSAANEVFTVAADGDQVRFTRNLGSIDFGLHDVETFDLNAAGGADVVHVAPVAGTDLTTLNTTFVAIGGGDDGQVDELLVPSHVTIGRNGAAATVDGLGPRIQVAGSGSDRIHVMGTGAYDTFPMAGTAGADTMNVTASGTDVVVSEMTPGVHVLLTAIERLDVELGAGVDAFSATGNLAALLMLDVDGGPGRDTLSGGNGADLLFGGDGDDAIDGQQGADTVSAGGGDDTVQWDPGDGNETIDGGSGHDRMVFTGANVAELFTMSADAGRVRVTRNVASIVLDLEGVETVDLHTFGANDVVQVNDLSGTDLTAVDIDLAGFGAASDGAADQVVVNGTSGDDVITVDAVGSSVQVVGLSATVRINGPDPTLDLLSVAGQGGADTLTGSPAAAALLQLDLLP